ncbi:hypothetical protein PENTCL1PPCAC_11141, partial [Pristionchus entomophagus]
RIQEMKIVLLLVAISAVFAKEECYTVKGKVECAHSELGEEGLTKIQIDLLDEDSLPLETDDLMGRTWADETGHFSVSGCGSDFGPLNTPDPYLKVYHTCPRVKDGTTSDERKYQVGFIPVPLPHINRVGTIFLE